MQIDGGSVEACSGRKSRKRGFTGIKKEVNCWRKERLTVVTTKKTATVWQGVAEDLLGFSKQWIQ